MPQLNEEMYKTLNLSFVNINELKKLFLDDTAILIEVLDLFLKQTPSKMEQLETAVSTSNFNQIRTTAHFLRSSYLTMGITIHKEFGDLEMEASLNNNKQVLIKYNSVLRLFEKCNFELKQLIEVLKKESI